LKAMYKLFHIVVVRCKYKHILIINGFNFWGVDTITNVRHGLQLTYLGVRFTYYKPVLGLQKPVCRVQEKDSALLLIVYCKI
jgi:hypothetical protein